MAQKAHDQAGLDAELSTGVDDGAVEAFNYSREGDTAGRVSLRIEEHLDMPDVVGVGAFEIGPGKVIEILFRDQHGHPLVVEVEKILQVSKLIGITQRVHRRIGQADAVAARQCEHQLRLQAALDMNVQLAFGELLDQSVHFGHAVASLSGVKPSAGRWRPDTNFNQSRRKMALPGQACKAGDSASSSRNRNQSSLASDERRYGRSVFARSPVEQVAQHSNRRALLAFSQQRRLDRRHSMECNAQVEGLSTIALVSGDLPGLDHRFPTSNLVCKK